MSKTPKSPAAFEHALALGVAVPQVMAHRLARMALAGASPSARDREEFRRMGTEKILALYECWSAMAAEALRANQQLALSLMLSLWFPWIRPPSMESVSRELSEAMLKMIGEGMAPIRRRAAANAKRLGRKRY